MVSVSASRHEEHKIAIMWSPAPRGGDTGQFPHHLDASPNLAVVRVKILLRDNKFRAILDSPASSPRGFFTDEWPAGAGLFSGPLRSDSRKTALTSWTSATSAPSFEAAPLTRFERKA